MHSLAHVHAHKQGYTYNYMLNLYNFYTPIIHCTYIETRTGHMCIIAIFEFPRLTQNSIIIRVYLATPNMHVHVIWFDMDDVGLYT